MAPSLGQVERPHSRMRSVPVLATGFVIQADDRILLLPASFLFLVGCSNFAGVKLSLRAAELDS